MRVDEYDVVADLLRAREAVERLAELCELERACAWEHPEPPFDGEWMEFSEPE